MLEKMMVRVLVFLGFVFGCPLADGAWQAVELKRTGTHIDVMVAGQPFTTFYFDPKVAKPYFQPLRSARGTVVTRGFPVENTVPPEHLHDRSLEPHQRPMYFGHGNVDAVDFWGEAVFSKWSDDAAFGRTVFRKLEEMRSGADSGSLRADFDLVDPKERVIGEETQAYTFRGDEQSRTIDCEFIIHATRRAPVVMGDTKEGTFAIRVVEALNSPPGHMVNSNGAEGEKAIWGKRADWVDYYGKVAEEELGIAIFDSPKSFRHPTTWHARGYGLFAVNPFGIREFTHDTNQDGSWTIPQGESLAFRYRVLIHHGNFQDANVAGAYQRYAAEQ